MYTTSIQPVISRIYSILVQARPKLSQANGILERHLVKTADLKWALTGLEPPTTPYP